MAKNKKEIDIIPEVFLSIEEAGEFWDSHSTADYDDFMKEVYFDVDIRKREFLVPIEGVLQLIEIKVG